MAKLLKLVEVSAVPYDGHEGYCRAGRRWTKAPAQVEVVKLADGEKLEPNQITREQFDVLEAEMRSEGGRIKVRVIASEDTPRKPVIPTQDGSKA